MNGPAILCVINSLEGGGAERVFVQVAAALADAFGEGAVEIALLDAEDEAYPAPAGVAKTVLGAQGSLVNSVRRLSAFAQARRPRLIVSFLTRGNCAAVAAARACGAAVLISERVHTTSHFGHSVKGRINRLAVRAAYPLADHVVAVSQGVAETLVRTYGVRRARLSVIPNPVDAQAIRRLGAAAPEISLPAHFTVAVGRLAPVKDFAMLIEAYARARLASDLVILGEGALRARLLQQALALGVADRLHMPGFLANPHAVMARAQAYVSSSRAEGFPNALAEAMALGLPAAATDCPSGPAELLGGEGETRGVTEARWGVLTPVGDVAAMAQALSLIASPAARERLGRAGAQRIEAFAPAAALSRWVALAERLLGAAAPRRGRATCGSA